MTTSLRELLPDLFEIEEVTDDVPEDSRFTEERDAVAGAVPTRRAEFFTVRECARRALARLGHAPAPILPGAHR